MSGRDKYSYYVEDKALQVSDRPRKFLEAFAAVLEHSSYGVALDAYTRTSSKCSRCAASCQLFQATGDSSDIPCHRSELLFKIYCRYFTKGGLLKARLLGGFDLTDEHLDEMADAFYRCTACRRCKLTCPMGVDHGLVTHLARWLLAEIDVIPKALLVSTREQLDSLNLVAYAYAMIQICFMVGAPNAKASAQALKDNAIACCIGGVAIVIAFNLLVGVPTFLFLLAVSLLATLFFSRQMFASGPMAKAYISGFVTFLVLLGTSTMPDKLATVNFYMRIGQILFAGLFAVAGLILVGHFLRPERKRILPTLINRPRE